MTNFFSKLFGRDKSKTASVPAEAVERALNGIINKSGFDLTYEVAATPEGFSIDFSGPDGELVTAKEGLLLDSFQIFIKRMLQSKFPDLQIDIQVDCNGFMESSAQELRELAERLKQHVLDRGGASYVRALPPRERKVVHRYLAEDARVKSQSIGDGFCKKIRISLVRDSQQPRDGGRHGRHEKDQETPL